MSSGNELVTERQARAIGPDAFDPGELLRIEKNLRDSLGRRGGLSPADLVVAAMWRQTCRPKVYPDSAVALIGEPLWYNAFYKPETANIVGFVSSAVGAQFQNDAIRLSKFQRPDSVTELSDREIYASMDVLNEAHTLPAYAAQNIGTRPVSAEKDLDVVDGLWHIQLHFEGRPGPENFFNAVTAIKKQTS